MTDIGNVNQEALFDQLADEYDLLLGDWKEDLKSQGRQLDALFRRYAGSPVQTVLDCTCGIGTQSIGLGLLGYRVTGTDISGKSVQRARQEAARFNLDIEFAKADLRHLDQTVSKTFDAVISCDNSLPALLTPEDVRAALGQMARRIEPSGICVISIRNFERILAQKTRFNPRHLHEVDGRRVIVFDVWDYLENGLVRFNVFFLKENDGGWDVACRQMVYRALYREDLTAELSRCGFKEIEILDRLDGEPLPFDFYVCSRR
ncbi:MAG: class I SAM-dependent methyltransferase [Desulfobacterales bacterium]|nr:class I SAM-dependent methyltransferase [Desulfobacterales bacterium]